jgi:hypothetical protein
MRLSMRMVYEVMYYIFAGIKKKGIRPKLMRLLMRIVHVKNKVMYYIFIINKKRSK